VRIFIGLKKILGKLDTWQYGTKRLKIFMMKSSNYKSLLLRANPKWRVQKEKKNPHKNLLLNSKKSQN
jgi:hypothetical protein